MGQKLKELEKN